MRRIIHLDADAFFASVEQAADPRLRGKPIAVGGEKRGIVASASYEARKFGVYTPMPTAHARKLCPKLIIVPGDFEKYERFSRWMFSYAHEFTPWVEINSIDEGYIDLSHISKPIDGIAQTLQKAIYQSLKITVSEGIASNKLVSQVASKLNKPAAFVEIQPGKEIPFLHPLLNKWLPGIGPRASSRLNSAGLARIGQIAGTSVELLHLLVGNYAVELKNFANGIDERPVVPEDAPAKSYGQQETFNTDQTDEEFIEATLRGMADHLMAKVREDKKSIRTVTVKVRYNDMAEDQCSESLVEPTDLETDIYPRLRMLLKNAWKRRVSLRLVCLRFSNVYEGLFRMELPLEASAQQQEARQRLAATIDELRRIHGKSVVFRGHDFVLKKAEQEERNPFAIPVGKGAVLKSSGTLVNESPARAYQAMMLQRQRVGSGFRTPKNHTTEKPVNPRPVLARTYVPLRIHSYYSFLNSTLSPRSIVDLARQHGMSAIALTDQGNLHGAVEFAQLAGAAGIKPVIGVEICVEKHPVRLYVQNAAGYRNLNFILNLMGQKGEYYSISDEDRESGEGTFSTLPSMRYENLKGRSDGLIAISSDIKLAEIFTDRFYVGISSLKPLRRQGRFHHVPMVLDLPVHYAKPEDRWKFDVVQSIRTRTLLRQKHSEKVLSDLPYVMTKESEILRLCKQRSAQDDALFDFFHFRPSQEVQEVFKDYPDLIARTHEIADRCSFEIPFGKPQFPSPISLPKDTESKVILHQLVQEGLRRRYPSNFSKYQAQVNEELSIILKVGYEEYFLLVWEILQECRKRGISWITRGSAADSLVCYCLGISDVCPIRFDLYFKRFLNEERMQLNKLPDMDIDFPHDRKDDVIDLIFAKYGHERAAIVGGFSTYQARSAIGDVAKVLGVSEYQIRRITERIARTEARYISETIAQSPECKDLPLEEDPYRSALKMAEFLDGFPRHPKMHPCGMVLSRQPMQELTPCFISNKGYPTTHFDMDAVESIGLVKMDILAQGGLSVMRDLEHELASRGIRIDLKQLEPWDDSEVWKMIATGGARAVHHIESPAMVGLCRMCNVWEIDGLIAIVSVIRPGAANEQKKIRFARRYQKQESATYLDPSLEPYLRNTYGMVVYEEHILQICEAFAGMSPGKADLVRRALGKQQQERMEELKVEFIKSALCKGHSEEHILKIWKLLESFQGYAFCKAHSTAYGVEAYQSAWLKRYYPVEFMAAVLSNGKGFYHPLVYILECHRLKIPLLPPDINEPGPHFAVNNQRIRVPVTRVKGITDKTKKRILEERRKGEFRSLQDFYRRVAPLPDEMELMMRVGAFDSFIRNRTAQFWEIQFLYRTFGHSSEPGQGWLIPISTNNKLPDVPLNEPTYPERLQWESELLGFTASGHPLDLYDDIAWNTYCSVNQLGNFVGQEVTTCGLVIEQRVHHQVTGEPMKFLTLADRTGMIETELFAKTYKTYGLATVRYPVLEITARVEPFENGLGHTLRVLYAGKPRKLGRQERRKIN